MLVRHPALLLVSLTSMWMEGIDAAITYTASPKVDPNDNTNFQITFGLNPPLGPDESVEIDYFSDQDCSSGVSATDLEEGTSYDGAPSVGDSEFTLTENVGDLDDAITASDNVFNFCVRATAKDTATSTVLDILEVNVALTTNGDASATITGIDADVNDPVSGTISNTFTASGQLCDGLDMNGPITPSSSTVLEGASLKICFTSDDFGSAGVGIIGMTEFSLSSSADSGGATVQTGVDILASGLISSNTCNGAASVEHCVVDLSKLPTALYLNVDDAIDVTVAGQATLTLQVGLNAGAGRRVKSRALVSEGDTGPVDAQVAPFTAAREDDNDGGFDFFAWLFSCFGLF